MIKKVAILSVSLCLLLTVCGSAIAPVYAQGPDQIAVSNSTIQVDYPNSLTFSCHVQNNTNITDIRLCQAFHRRKPREPAFIIVNDRSNCRLLEHDLRRPNLVRIFGSAPWQVTPVAAIPGQKRFRKFSSFNGIIKHAEGSHSWARWKFRPVCHREMKI